MNRHEIADGLAEIRARQARGLDAAQNEVAEKSVDPGTADWGRGLVSRTEVQAMINSAFHDNVGLIRDIAQLVVDQANFNAGTNFAVRSEPMPDRAQTPQPVQEVDSGLPDMNPMPVYRADHHYQQVHIHDDLVWVGPVGTSRRMICLNKRTGMVQAGCWAGTVQELRARVTDEYSMRLAQARQDRQRLAEASITSGMRQYLDACTYFEYLMDYVSRGG